MEESNLTDKSLPLLEGFSSSAIANSSFKIISSNKPQLTYKFFELSGTFSSLLFCNSFHQTPVNLVSLVFGIQPLWVDNSFFAHKYATWFHSSAESEL